MGKATKKLKKLIKRLLPLLLLVGLAAGGWHLYQSGRLDPLIDKVRGPQAPALSAEQVKALARASVAPVTVRFKRADGGEFVQQGSAVAVSDRDLWTAHHVVKADGVVEKVLLTNAQGAAAPATLGEVTPSADLAALTAEGHGLKPLALAKHPPKAGDPIFIAGFPEKYAGVVSPELLLTTGEVLDPQWTTELVGVKVIKATAKTDQGGSGGAMLNAQGELCGVVIAASSAQDKTTYVYAVPLPPRP